MKGRPTYVRAVYLLCLIAGCSSRPPMADVPPHEQPTAPQWPPGYPLAGEPCTDDIQACGWDTSLPASPALMRCTGGVWSITSRCDDACDASDQCSAGCAVIDGGAACLCAPGSASCGKKATCANHARVAVPEGADIDCISRCREGDELGFSEGCGAKSPGADEECLCTRIGAPCDLAQRGEYCFGPALPDSNTVLLVTPTIARCVAGRWSSIDCAEYCGDPLATCRGPHTEEAHACSCDVT